MKKIGFWLLPLSLLALTGTAQADESIQDAMRKCGSVQNSLKRLVCYDDIVNNLERYSGLDDLMNIPAPLPPSAAAGTTPSAPVATQQAPKAQQEQSTTDRFGFEHKRANVDTEERIFAKVTKVKKGPYDKVSISLDNGQVWKETDSMARLKVKVDDEIYIEKGALGAFFLGKEGLNKRLKVKRVK